MTPLDFALHYAARGWRVCPVEPGRKHPSIKEWQKAATTDAERITKYWGLNPTHGMCIATGYESGVFAVDIDPDHGGDDSLHALETEHGALPDTVISLTGGGGTHCLFAWPTDGREIRNNQSGRLGVGIDVRGEGGQIVVAPSVHASGRQYAWDALHDPTEGQAVTDAPEWLLDLLCTPPAPLEPRRPPRGRLADDPMPGDWWSARTDWPTELARHGWQIHSRHHDIDGSDYELWTRPGKDVRDGASASLYYRGSDVLKVFSTSCAPLQAEATYTLWGFHVAMVHGGDFEAAARAVRNDMPRTTSGDNTPIEAVNAPARTSPPCPHCGSTKTRARDV